MEHKRWVTSVVQRAILLVTLVSSASAACKNELWTEYHGSCYRFMYFPSNWFYSGLLCKFLGAGLVVIRSQSENEFLLTLTQSRNFWINMVNIFPSNRHTAGYYRWFDNSYTRLNYTALKNVSSASYHDCVHSDSTGRWHNTYCQNEYSFVCKAPAEQDCSDKQHRLTAAVLDSNDAFYNATLTLNETAARIKCPSGWHQLDSSCYFHSLNQTNYFNAQLSCQAMGASVTSVLSWREHTLLTVLLGCNMPTWIGLKKRWRRFKQPGRNHYWVWMDGSAVSEGNMFWAPNEPKRRRAKCVIMDSRWKVTNCYDEFGYLCKRSL